MTLEDLLVQKKAAVVKQWRRLIFQTYPDDSREFLSGEKDRFQNPVGYTIAGETERLYDALLAEKTPDDRFFSAIEAIVKIRSVQDFSASQAVAFIFLLKKAIREQLTAELRRNGFAEQLLVFESKIDELALVTFDSYMRCREKINQIRLNQAKNGLFKLREPRHRGDENNVPLVKEGAPER